ncbi:hydroxyethylthiazole kinase [Novacetimonas hansenii]|uniref:hydroxyethylthiazole kinase n=1 Tax=Novacetimonas hansenii TaxID=436 RepID=UPI00248DE5B5|nr:hydroxyethylthiazole kinase [Novacetimonas hansenii]
MSMITVSWDDPVVRDRLGRIRQQAPFIYGVTNYVAATLSANVLLAVGAAPAIGTAPGWPEAFGASAAAVWINTAALISTSEKDMLHVAACARDAGVPWVLDPVAFGAGSAEYDRIVRRLLDFAPAVIRGNASELMALAGGDAGGKGVETTHGSDDALRHIQALAARSGAVVAVSGATDYIASGSKVFAVTGGDVRLTRVTGAGCALGALIAAFLPVCDTAVDAACGAHATYAAAAERAGRHAVGTGAFGAGLLDELSVLAGLQ